MNQEGVNSRTRYSSLDGLRAFAALGIVMMHVWSNLTGLLSIGFVNRMVASFTNFTFLFMIISAFGMSVGYYGKFSSGNYNLSDFYKKRYTRILPFFSLLVLIDLVLKPSLSELYEAFADLTLVFGLLPNADITVIGVGWFLGVIFVFYMIFPFFVFLIGNKRRAWIVLVISCLLHILSASYFSRPELMVNPVGRSNIVYSFPFFVSGGIIFLYREKIASFADNYMKWVSLGVVLALVVAYYSLPNFYLLLDLLLFSALLVWAIVRSEKKGLLNNSFVKFISNISMEIYLCHMLFFRVVEYLHLERVVSNKDMLFVVTFILTISGAIAFSWVWKSKIEPLVLQLIERRKIIKDAQ